jgi:putative ABC transport system substrate-binding protein
MPGGIRRRELIAAIGGMTAAWPLAARSQQAAMPVIGFLHSLSSDYIARFAPAVRQGLKQTGYIEGQNVTIEYHSADGQYDRLPNLVADLISRKVDIILTAGGSDPAKLAKAATATIPIVFVTAADPVRAGVVGSFDRPGGNITGVSLIGSALEAKRLELLHQLVSGTALIGALVNPQYPDADLQVRELEEAAGEIRRQIAIMRASTIPEMETAFGRLAQRGAGAVLVAVDPFFAGHYSQIVALAAGYKLPAIYGSRVFVEAGGLMFYGTQFEEGYRQAGIYVGKVLKGTNPGDLPVVQPTKFELIINAATAKALDLQVPPMLLALADEVIE